MRLAFEAVGCRCVFSSDWDAHAQKTYAANFGEVPIGNIRQVASADIPKHHILTAGFPCQPFSISGVSKKKSLGRAHGFQDATQGTLFFEVARIIRDKQPEAFVLENVKNLVGHDRGRTFKVILHTLEDELEYSVDYKVIDARAFVPQHRERIFIVGFRRPRQFQWPPLPEGKTRIKNILEVRPDEKYHLTDRLWTYLQNYARKHRAAGNGSDVLIGSAFPYRTRRLTDSSEIRWWCPS
jgi:DNA (cytosine-5)-methyltransferase 1